MGRDIVKKLPSGGNPKKYCCQFFSTMYDAGDCCAWEIKVVNKILTSSFGSTGLYFDGSGEMLGRLSLFLINTESFCLDSLSFLVSFTFLSSFPVSRSKLWTSLRALSYFCLKSALM